MCNSWEHVCHEINNILLHFGKIMTVDVCFFAFQCVDIFLMFPFREGLEFSLMQAEMNMAKGVTFWCPIPLDASRHSGVFPDTLKIRLASFLRLVKICSGCRWRTI